MPDQLKKNIFTYATQTLGFDDCRLTSAFLYGKMQTYKNWLAHHNHADMTYLKKHLSFKENPRLLLKNVQSAIVVIKNYKNTSKRQLSNRLKIARYAIGKDYHIVMGEKLRALEQFIKNQDSIAQCFIGVDSQPIAERSLALESGIGFLGKNSMVIKPGLGSYFFIGVILTTLQFKHDLPLQKNCGACRLCIDACPTNAINNNYTPASSRQERDGRGLAASPKASGGLNANRCISYQTIERKTPLTEEEIQNTRGWIFGCDICQEVCPYNHPKVPLTDWEEFLPKSGVSFDIFEKSSKIIRCVTIPKDSALYRSRKTVVPNCATAQRVFLLKDKN